MGEATVRAKFRVSKVEPSGQPEGGGRVTLEAVTSGSEENKSFFNYTPYGRLDIGTVNDNAFQQFHEGEEFYLDFTPAPK